MSREQQLKDSIFVMNPNRTDVQGVNMDDLIASGGGGFGIGGHIVDINGPACMCKIDIQLLDEESPINRQPVRRPLYFVRMDGAGALYDPWGIDEGAAAKLNKHKGAENWAHRRVSRTVFEQYLTFLKTRNKAHLLNAQRISR